MPNTSMPIKIAHNPPQDLEIEDGRVKAEVASPTTVVSRVNGKTQALIGSRWGSAGLRTQDMQGLEMTFTG